MTDKMQWPSVDELAQQIRWMDGSHKLGAASLAEKILDWMKARPAAPSPGMPSDLAELAEKLMSRLRTDARRRNSAYDYYGMDNTPESIDPDLCAFIAAALRSPADQGEKDRKDAERYRWLRDYSDPSIGTFYISVTSPFHGIRFTPDTVDRAIDDQMGRAAIDSTKGGT